MNPLINRRTFGRLAVAGAALVISTGALAGVQPSLPAKVSPLTERFAVAGQINPDQLADLKARGYTTIISLRPDGEGADQPSSVQMEAAARSNGMSFAYVPVTPGPIPDSAVEALTKATAGTSGKVLMYCRSGSRAARTWGLVEASRPDGADAPAIMAAVKASGQSADDLREAISQRVSARNIKK